MDPCMPAIFVPAVGEIVARPSHPVPRDGDTADGGTEAILVAIAQAVEQRDPHTARHCERLASISVALGMALHLDRLDLMALYRGGYCTTWGRSGYLTPFSLSRPV